MEKRFGVAVKAIIIMNDKILFLYRSDKEMRDGQISLGRRDLPGGRVEFGESLQEALVREVKEETGLRIKTVIPLTGWHYVNEKFQLVGIDYLCEYVSGNVVLSDEHEFYEWLSLEEIIEKGWSDIEKYKKVYELYKQLKAIDLNF